MKELMAGAAREERKHFSRIGFSFLALMAIYMGSSVVLGLVMGRLAPVSYTHLDVYKRQIQQCPRSAKPTCKWSLVFGDVFRRLAGTVCPCACKRRLIIRDNCAFRLRLCRCYRICRFRYSRRYRRCRIPVSYTHLDVYKRQ